MLNLKFIQLNSSQIESNEKDVFSKLNYLSSLNLANNKINNIREYYFEKLFNLTLLDLSKNSIEIIYCNSFNDLQSSIAYTT